MKNLNAKNNQKNKPEIPGKGLSQILCKHCRAV